MKLGDTKIQYLEKNVKFFLVYEKTQTEESSRVNIKPFYIK